MVARQRGVARTIATGARPSPNIWHNPATYELENHAADPHGRLWALFDSLGGWRERHLLDIGCGTGFHLPRFAETAASVVGVEPHGDLVTIARRRTRRLDKVRVLHGSATELPLPPASVDVVHARWAYFFGPGCEPGLAELDRVMRRGGRAFVIDNDPTASTFGSWFARGFPEVDPLAVQRFWTTRGWDRHRVEIGWEFEIRQDFEAVVRIELPTAVAEQVLTEHAGSSVDYAVNVWTRSW